MILRSRFLSNVEWFVCPLPAIWLLLLAGPLAAQEPIKRLLAPGDPIPNYPGLTIEFAKRLSVQTPYVAMMIEPKWMGAETPALMILVADSEGLEVAAATDQTISSQPDLGRYILSVSDPLLIDYGGTVVFQADHTDAGPLDAIYRRPISGTSQLVVKTGDGIPNYPSSSQGQRPFSSLKLAAYRSNQLLFSVGRFAGDIDTEKPNAIMMWDRQHMVLREFDHSPNSDPPFDSLQFRSFTNIDFDGQTVVFNAATSEGGSMLGTDSGTYRVTNFTGDRPRHREENVLPVLISTERDQLATEVREIDSEWYAIDGPFYGGGVFWFRSGRLDSQGVHGLAYMYKDGRLRHRLRSGDPAPDALGWKISQVGLPAVTRWGLVAFVATLEDELGNQRDVIYAGGTTGSLSRVVDSADLANEGNVSSLFVDRHSWDGHTLVFSASFEDNDIIYSLPASPGWLHYGNWIETAYPNSPDSSYPLADPDRDQVPNLIEFALGGNPDLADAERTVPLTIDTAVPDGEIHFSFKRRKGSQIETEIVPQVSTLLAGNWRDETDGVIEMVSSTDSGDGITETICYRTTNALGTPDQLYMRLSVSFRQ